MHEKNKKIIILINDDGGRTRGKGRPRNRKSLFFHHTPFIIATFTTLIFYLGFNPSKKVRRKFTPTPTPTTSRAHVCGVRVRDRDRDRDGDMSVCQKLRKFRSCFSFR